MRRRQLKYAVMALHEKNPTWTARQLSIALDCSQEYIRRTAYRNGLSLKSHSPSKQAWNVKSVLPLKLLPVPIPALPECNERIAAR